MSLEDQLKQKTAEFMTTCSKQSHKRTRLFMEMQELNRKIKNEQAKNELTESV